MIRNQDTAWTRKLYLQRWILKQEKCELDDRLRLAQCQPADERIKMINRLAGVRRKLGKVNVAYFSAVQADTTRAYRKNADD